MTTSVLSSRRVACKLDRNSKYLRCVYDKSKQGIRVDASAARVVGSARTRFFFEVSDQGERLVHIRCSYNEKYWVPEKVVEGGATCWVIGTANEADEDRSKPSCTLFQYTAISDKSYRFYHPGLGKYVCIADETKTYLQLRDDGSDTFTIIGLSHQKELPKHVVFKGDDGRYLRPETFPPASAFRMSRSAALKMYESILPKYLSFGKHDKGDASVLHTTFTNDEGLVRIQCSYKQKFWKNNPRDFIVADSTEEDFNNPYTLFKVVSAGGGFIALQNVGNQLFCKKLTGYGEEGSLGILKIDCLSATTDQISEGKLIVEEPIRDRKIFDVKYHIEEARVYDLGSIPIKEQTYPNPHDAPESLTLTYTTKRTVDIKWETSVSLKTGEEVRSSFGIDVEIPLPKQGKIQPKGEYSKTVTKESTTSDSQGKSESVTDEFSATQIVNLPPKTVKKIKLVRKQTHYDIPFSYKENATLMKNGEELETVSHDDGVLTMTESYDFYDNAEDPLY